MDLTIIITIIAAGLLLAVFTLATALAQAKRQQRSIRKALKITPAENLPAAASRLAAAAAAAEAVPLLSTRLEHLLRNCSEMMLLLDEKRTIIGLSAKTEEKLDQPRKNRGLMETLESYELDDAARKALASLTPVKLTARLFAGGRRPFRCRLFPYRTATGPECIIFFEDISAELDFGALRSQFAATVSHELRTPLAGIRALVESLRDPDISKEESARFLERVEHEASRLSQLVDEILFLSSLESGEIASIKGETELAVVVDRVLEKLLPLATKFGVSTKSKVPTGLKVPLPERMAAMVISNLVENAIKYSGRGSRAEVLAKKDGSSVKITVRDDGIGIDAEHLPHIFERFYRVDKSRSRRLGGTGLGLSIVKHVVESAGGEVRASSREGFGTEIVINLPLPRPGGAAT